METTMTEEDFLTRWSRRKREVAKAERQAPVQPRPASDDSKAGAIRKEEPEFDVTTLPPIESINALTDVTAFLRAGVPVELTRAALRRVWTADPAIRDFVGLAENAWDFTDPNAMPGFGPLEATEQIRRMVAGVVDKIGEAAQSAPTSAIQSASDSKALIESHADEQPLRVAGASPSSGENVQEPADSQVLLQSNKVDAAAQHDPAEGEEGLSKSSRRSHGGALPQ
jgi:hypothetical protein